MAEYINREALLRITEQQGHVSVDDIVSEPAADVAPVVHGRWLTHYRSGVTVAAGFVSSCCDMWAERWSDYCPHCGAKMDL